MKRFHICLMAVIILFAITACGENDTAKLQKDETTEQINVEVAEETVRSESVEEATAEETDLLTLNQVTWEHLTQKTLPEEGAWLKETDKVSLVAAIEEKDIYLYCLHNGHPWGGEGVILQYGEMFQTYPLWCLVKYSYPVLESGDIDSDGEEELLLIMGRSGGTGLYIEDLYVFEPDGEGYSCIALETKQIAAMINEQVSFDLLDDGSLQACCQDGSETNMAATRDTWIFLDHISYEVENESVVLSISVQVMKKNGQWKYLCDYIDNPDINKETCAAAEYIHTVEAEVVYDGKEFSLVNLRFEEAERVD